MPNFDVSKLALSRLTVALAEQLERQAQGPERILCRVGEPQLRRRHDERRQPLLFRAVGEDQGRDNGNGFSHGPTF